MVALLRPDTGLPAPLRRTGSSGYTGGGSRRLALVVDNGTVARRDAARSRSRPAQNPVIGGLPVDATTLAAAVLLALVMVGGLFAVRLSQGPASAQLGTGQGVGGQISAGQVSSVGGATPSAAAVESVGPVFVGSRSAVSLVDGGAALVAQPGDSLWSIAMLVAPESDPRPTVAALIEANGGDSVRIGQQIVIPEQLLD